MEENKRISDLFERARVEAPKTSFDEMKDHFLAASTVVGTGLLAKWAAASFKLKAIIMTSGIIGLTVSSLIVASSIRGSDVKKEQKEKKTVIIPMENLEIIQEDGVRETIIYDDKDQVVEVIIDSSEKMIDPFEKAITQDVSLDDLSDPFVDIPEVKSTPKVTPKEDAEKSKVVKPNNEKRFTITEKTTTEELDEIRKLAETAGIKMKYNARIKKNIIKQLSMSWSLKSEDNRSNWNIVISGSDDFSVEVGWEEDENGKAKAFLNDKRTESGSTEVNVSSGRNGGKVEIRN